MIPDVSPRHFAIVPAAGYSRRMGQPKLLLPFGESTVIEKVIAAWHAGGVNEVLIVCRSDDQPLIEKCQNAGAVVVTPDVPPPEMKDSVLAALFEIERRFEPRSCDTWMMAPADMPHLSFQVIRKLIEAHEPSRASIIAPVHAGKRGHPVLFPWQLAAEVAKLGTDCGINELLVTFPVADLECGPDARPGDIDVYQDYLNQGGTASDSE